MADTDTIDTRAEAGTEPKAPEGSRVQTAVMAAAGLFTTLAGAAYYFQSAYRTELNISPTNKKLGKQVKQRDYNIMFSGAVTIVGAVMAWKNGNKLLNPPSTGQTRG